MLESRSLFALLVVLLITNVSCNDSDESDDESDDASLDAGSQDDVETDDAETEDADSVDISKDGGPDAEPQDDSETHCPNGIPEDEWFEDCDDGNYFDNDGCTRLCTFSCEDDEECDDLNDCNGKETCGSDNACKQGEWGENGDVCGNNKSCYEGLCVADRCGDGVVNEGLGEVCDDGNTIDDDDCSNDCTYGCTSDDDCRDGDPCAGTTTCDEESHACSGPTLDDETVCETTEIENGWCMKNVCVPSDCGDGKKEGNEECDDGKDNGSPESTCSVNCRIADCGNGTIEGDEECDDGNEDSFDSCDKNCKAEIYYRWNTIEILGDPSPNWCVYAGMNAFAIAFPGEVPVKLRDITIQNVDIRAQVNDQFAAVFEDCTANRLIQVLDLDDPSFQTSDDEVNVTFQFGELASGQTCESPMALDTELVLFSDTYENGAPVLTIPAIQRPGLLQSANPIDLPAQQEETVRGGDLYDFKFQLQMDIEHLSTPPYLERSDGVEAVKLPETMGVNPDPGEPYHPAGRLCAAMSQDGMQKAKIVEGTQNTFCCSSPGSPIGVRKYVACPEDDPDGDCESEDDIVTNGCVICINDITLDQMGSVDDLISTDCGGGDFSECLSSFEVVHPSPPDVDTDGDGENDARTILFAVEGVRVQSDGLKD